MIKFEGEDLIFRKTKSSRPITLIFLTCLLVLLYGPTALMMSMSSSYLALYEFYQFL